MASSPKHPAEIFGYPVESTTDEAAHVREQHWCPFLDEKCWKQSRNLDMPFGVCSVRYMGKVMATCPSRFLQQRRVFQDIAQLHFWGSEQPSPIPRNRNPRTQWSQCGLHL